MENSKIIRFKKCDMCIRICKTVKKNEQKYIGSIWLDSLV